MHRPAARDNGRVTAPDLGDAALSLAGELVAVDSTNPGLAAGAPGERAVVDHLRRRLEGSGFVCEVVQAAVPDRPSLLARPPAGRCDGPTVILNGHLDTVPAGGMADAFDPRIVDGRLLGRGSADMKSGLAGLVVAAEALLAADAPVRPVLALVADEEDASLGSEAVIDALPRLGIRPECCLVAEPTHLALASSLRGFAVVEVAFAGSAAHSSQPELGVNAATHLGRFLAAVEGRGAEIARSGGSLMVTLARAGTSAFVLPASASCTVERRTVPGERAAAALAEVEELIAGLRRADPSVEATARLVAHREAWSLEPRGPARDLADRLGSALGTRADFDAPYWMEATLWEAVCPTLVCGPSGGGLHADDEWVDVAELRAFATALPGALAGGPRAH